MLTSTPVRNEEAVFSIHMVYEMNYALTALLHDRKRSTYRPAFGDFCSKAVTAIWPGPTTGKKKALVQLSVEKLLGLWKTLYMYMVLNLPTRTCMANVVTLQSVKAASELATFGKEFNFTTIFNCQICVHVIRRKRCLVCLWVCCHETL
jgi:hypothetical protein